METHDYDDVRVLPELREQLGLALAPRDTYFSAPEIDPSEYDHIIIGMSGGKDSIAALLRLLDLGLDRDRLELWHHDVDGREGSTLMDWPFMADYNRKIAEAFEIPLYFSWLEGGLEGELCKENAYSKPHHIETPDGLMILPRDERRSSPGTRLRFPQQSASLASRWCSSAGKIDVGRRALNNQVRFNNKKVLFVTGERRQESSNRSRYNQLERHACDRRDGRKARHVDAWRPVLEFSEEQVWDLLQKHQLLPPVPYRLGWGRSSCLGCVFSSQVIWSTIAAYFPDKFGPIAKYEQQFGVTINRNRIPIVDIAKQQRPLQIDDLEALKQAMETAYTLPVFATPEMPWHMPAGAFSTASCGAT